MAKDYKQIRLLAQQALNALDELDELVGLEGYGIDLQDELDHLLDASPLDELASYPPWRWHISWRRR